MQAVGGLFSGGGGGFGLGSSGGGYGDGQWGDMGPTGGGVSSSDILGGLRLGTSAVSALSTFALSQSQSAALNMEAGNEELAARGDYVQAQQKSNAINMAFNHVIGAQLSDASAGNIDVGSGSVQEAGYQAERQRDRAIGAVQSSARIDASIRTARAGMLRQSAAITSTTGILSGIADVAKAGLSFASLGGD